MAIEVTFVNGSSVIYDDFLNNLQEALTGLSFNFRLEQATPTSVRVVGGAGNNQASILVNGLMRYSTATKTLTITGGAGTYNIYVTADTPNRDFALVRHVSTPSATNYRKIGEVVWDGAAITEVRNLIGGAPSHNPVFTGDVVVPTLSGGDNSTKAANTATVRSIVGQVAPAGHASSHHSGGSDALSLGSIAGTIATAQIGAGAVTLAKMASNSVDSVQIIGSAVTGAKIAANNVGTAHLANNAVTDDKLASNAVTTAKIADSNVTTAKLASNAVTTAKIADSNVTTAKLADDAVTADKIAAGAWTTIREHTFAVMGEVYVAVDDASKIPPFFVQVASGTQKRIIGWRCSIIAGTSATIQVQKNGVSLGSAINATVAGASVTNRTDVLSSGDKIGISVTSVSGGPVGLSFSVLVEESSV